MGLLRKKSIKNEMKIYQKSIIIKVWTRKEIL